MDTLVTVGITDQKETQKKKHSKTEHILHFYKELLWTNLQSKCQLEEI